MPFVGQPYHKNDSPSSSHADFKCVRKRKCRIQFQLVLSRTWNSGVQLVITKYVELIVVIYLPFFFNWDSLYARPDSHYQAWSQEKEAQKDKSIQEICSV